MSTLWGVFSTLEDIMSTLGYHEYTGRYHDKCGGKSLGKQLNLYGYSGLLNIPGVLMLSSHTHHGIPSPSPPPPHTHTDRGIPPVY